MIDNPLISVVIPCFNDGLFLPETLAHLKKQTFTEFEIIVVNDGSTDPFTLDILQKISADGIKVLHKENGRMSSARNHGVQHAKGRLIVALDADDYFHPDFFKKAIDVLEQDERIAVVTSYIQLFGAYKKVSKPRGGDENNFLFSNQCPACAMVRKSCWDEVGGYDEEMIWGYEDWEFYIRITQKKWTVYVIPEKLFYYRQTKKSTHKNDTLPNREKIISYIVEKHKDWYTSKLKELITREEIIYTESRISFPRIAKMFKNRLLNKHK
jgi:glycosyltransferase involved in cell wall biosynthesis